MHEPLRLLILGAHPDDAEFHAGGLAAAYAAAGHAVKMVSITDGGAGHHRMSSAELVRVRRAEAAASGRLIGAEYVTWDFPDGRLEPSLEVREAVIREIRLFQPDLVLTHRPCDYHPDHRAVGQVVQDASYLVTVPLILPDVPALREDPIVAYMVDHFTKPYPFEADVVVDIEPYIDTVISMLCEHASQVFEFLPDNFQVDEPVPDDSGARRAWLKSWFTDRLGWRRRRFDEQVSAQYGDAAESVRWIEAYEISEYARQMSEEAQLRLFALA